MEDKFFQSQFIIILASFSFTLVTAVVFFQFRTVAMSKNKAFLYICFHKTIASITVFICFYAAVKLQRCRLKPQRCKDSAV